MDPGTALLLSSGANMLGGLFSGGQEAQQQLPVSLHNVNPLQSLLYRKLINQFATGSGDFGFGTAAKQGMSTVRQLMADRGIAPESGVYQSALATVLGQAAQGDVAARRQYGMGLLNTPMQVMGASGHNYGYGKSIWKSPTANLLRGY